MKERSEIQEAILALRGMLHDQMLFESQRNALEMAIQFMEPVYGLSTIQWERFTYVFDLSGEMSPEEADRAVRYKAPSELADLIAPNMQIEKMYDFPTNTIHVKASVFVGQKEVKL